MSQNHDAPLACGCPTCVGMYLTMRTFCARRDCLPHMRGDLPGSTLYSLAEAASAPCVWGRALGLHLAKATEGVYPTCVGIYPHCDGLR